MHKPLGIQKNMQFVNILRRAGSESEGPGMYDQYLMFDMVDYFLRYQAQPTNLTLY